MKRHKECSTSGINQWNKKRHPTPSHSKGIGKLTLDSEGEEVHAYEMVDEDSADEEIPDENTDDSEDYEKTLDYKNTYTSIDEHIPTPTPREKKKSLSFISGNIARELKKRVMSTDRKSFSNNSFLVD